MKRKFTLLIAALALLTMIVQPGRAWGQTYEKATSISVGDIVVLVTEKTNFARELTGFSSTNTIYGIGVEYTGTPTGAYTFEVVAGNADGSYAFKHDNVYLNWASGNSLNTATSLSNNTSWTVSFSGTDATIKNVNTDARQIWWNVSSHRFACYTGKSDGNQYYITTLYKQADAPTVATPIFTPASGTEFGNEGLEVTIACETTGASIYYTLDGTTPDNTSTPYTAALNLTTTTTVKAIAYDGTNYSNVATATYTYVDPDAPGTANNPYSVAEAITAIDEQGTINEAYVTGIVSQVDSYNSNYNSITYWISDDGTTTDQLEVYSGKGINGADFTSINDIALGAEVVVKGKLKKFGEVYEFDYNNELVSYQAPTVVVAAPTFSPVAGTYATAQNVEINCATANTTIFYTLDGTDPTNASTEYSTAIPVENTTTIKAKAYAGNESSTVATANYYICSQDNPYTVTEALGFEDYQYPANGIYVHGLVSTAPTAAPTSDGQLTYFISVDGEATNQLQVYKGKGLNNVAFTAQDDIQVGDIVTIYGNVKIYNNTKEFDAGNYLVEFERPVVPVLATEDVSIAYDATEGDITYTLENPAQDGVLTAEITAGNEGNWLTLGTVGQNVPFTCTANTGAERTATVTLTYTYNNAAETKTATAVVTQAAYVAPVASITVNPAIVNATAAETEGTITVTYENITTVEAEVYFCDAQGAATTYEWVDAEIDNDDNVYYTIDANTGEARTAYFKVSAFDDATNIVYSNLVTINQAAPVTPGTWVLTDLADLTANDIFVIVGDNGDTYAMPYNGGGQSGAPAAVTIAIANDALTAEPAAELQWNISGNATDGYVFYPNGNTESWLYCTDANNGVRVGTNDNKTFVLDSESGYLQNTATSRYVGIYNSQDWRCYTNTTGNIAGQTFAFYKKVTGPVPVVPTITITPPEVTNVPAAGDVPEHTVTLANMTVTSTDDFEFVYCDSEGNILDNQDPKPNWIELADAEYSLVSNNVYNMVYTVAANEETTPRTGYFKIGVEQTSGTVYSNLVTITQEAYVAPVPSITIAPAQVTNVPAAGDVPEHTVTLANMTITSTDDFEFVYCDSEGNILDNQDPKPNWIELADAEYSLVSNNVYNMVYTVAANEETTPRTGYFKIGVEQTSGTVYSNLVTVTQAGLVVDYATLPFVWEGGSSADLKALTGVTTSTLSADYAASHAPYLIKFDNDGKYIQVKTDSQPAKVTIGVKMIGGANTSYITVMASTDGNTFDDGEQLAISGNSGSIVNLETTRTFASDVRYVKMVFTKGSNVGVGPITITKYTTDPIINADDVDLAYDATSGEIPYTITNPVTSVSLAATTTADWISNITVNDEKVSFTTTQNESTTARTATFTLTYTSATDKTVTVTQGAIDYATIPFAFDGGKADIENTRGLTENGLDSDYSSSPKLKFNTTGDWVVLKLNAAPISLSYDIKGNSFSGGTFTVQTSEDGEDYEDLATYTELGDVQSITHINLATTVRYIKWVYTEKSNGNVALGNIHASNEYDTYGDVTIDSDALATHSVTVHSGSVVTFVGTNTNADKLVIEDGGQLIVSNSGVQATFKKSVSHSAAKDANNWYTISSPVNNITPSAVTNLIQTPADNYDLYYYDEENVMWKNHKKAAITNLTNGKGYLYWNAGGDELSFPGELNSGNIEIALTKTGTGDLAGWNLIGNPYSHNIYKGAGTAIVNSVSEGYELTTGFYTLANSGAWVPGTDNTTAIVPGQGILVKATTAGTLTMTNANSSGTAKANNDNIQFLVSNSEYEDITYALFNTGIGLDKINHRNADIPMVYIPQNGQNYAIATMDDNTQAFELNFKAMTTGQYTLSYKAEGKYSYLHVIDRLTGEDIDMLLDGEYSFIGSPRDNEARFIVKLNYNANIDEIEVNDNFAYQNGSDIIVNGNGELQVFDVTGRMVMNTKINGIQTVNVPATGMYIFRMVGESVQTQKIVVR